jgi:aryl-alcohol dehydrogenase-like predicted oxidoreductase
MALDLGLGVTPWSPLGGGILTGKYNKMKLGEAKSDRGEFVTERLSERNLAIAVEVEKVAAELGRTSSQVALAWLTAQPGVTSPIVGARTLAQLEDNLDCLGLELSPAHLARLDGLSRVELGFPMDFLSRGRIREFINGGTKVEAKV